MILHLFSANVTYVGFSAYRSSGDRVGGWQRIPYDTVITEVGGAYDPSTGIFTCPVNGYYYFSLSSFSTVRSACDVTMLMLVR